MDENKVSDKAQCAAIINNVSVVSGLGGRLFAQSTRRVSNLKHVTVTKIMVKVRVKKSISLAMFFTVCTG
jgi:hypothetical protein